MAIYADTSTSSAAFTGTSEGIRYMIRSHTDSIGMVDFFTDKYFPKVKVEELLNTCCFVSAQYTGNPSIIDSVAIHDINSIVWDALIQESTNLTDSGIFDPNFYNAIGEQLVLLDLAPNSLEAQLLIQDSIEYLDILINAWGIHITDAFGLSSLLVNNLALIKEILSEVLNIADDATFVLNIFTIVNENIDIDENLSVGQVLQELLKDIITFGGGIVFDGVQYTFVLNTENEAISQYTNYNFNSISDNFAASDTGIYELIGNDDDGINIDASFKTALMDFGTSRHKQLPYMYIGFTSDDELLIKVINDLGGVKTERWYKAKQPRAADDTTRIKFGRGVKGKYWQFELANINGSNFDIDSIELLPLTLKRRI